MRASGANFDLEHSRSRWSRHDTHNARTRPLGEMFIEMQSLLLYRIPDVLKDC